MTKRYRKMRYLKQFDVQARVAFNAIRELMAPPAKPRGKIGYEGGE